MLFEDFNYGDQKMSKDKISTVKAFLGRPNLPRRGFLARALGLSAGAGAVGLAGTGGTASAQLAGVNDPAIVAFALNLEYLEAQYYTYATTGNNIQAAGIPVTGSGIAGSVTIKANPKVPFQTAAIQQYAIEITLDEQAHVTAERGVLNQLIGMPVAQPSIDLLNSFNALAQVAGLGNSFDPFANEINFLIGAYIFEDVGVSAYHGAAPLISSRTILGAAAGILGTEAYHAGLIRTVLFQQGGGAITDAISKVRLALGGGPDYGVDNGPFGSGPAGNASIVLTDSSGITTSRSTRQVLNIVYGGVNAMSGLFFPNGMNGPIH